MPAFGPLYGGNSMLDCLSHLFEDKHLDLPHPLARDAEFEGEHSKRDRVFGPGAALRRSGARER